MNIKVAIFDFDGTLADTRAPIVMAKQDTMRDAGLPVADEEACAATIGLTAKAGFQKLFPDLPDAKQDELVVKYRARFDELIGKMPPTRFPGVDEVLGMLREKGIVCTIATSRNRKSLYEFLDGWGMTDVFAYILTGDDTKLLKPDPEPVRKTLRDLSISPEEALVIGDMPVDIAMGKGAGASTVGVTYGNSDREALRKAGADFVIDNIRELPEILALHLL